MRHATLQTLLPPVLRYFGTNALCHSGFMRAGIQQVYMLNKGPGVVYDGSNAGDGTTIHIAQVRQRVRSTVKHQCIGSSAAASTTVSGLHAKSVASVQWHSAATFLGCQCCSMKQGL
jgi:hypothetical protein